MYMPKNFGDSAISFQFVSGMKEFRFFLDNWGWGGGIGDESFWYPNSSTAVSA